jgi:hypothetical protein
MISPDQSILQMSWVVRNLEEAAQRWHRTTGIGPFLINRHLAVTKPRYRGAPSATDFSTAIAQAGPIQVELVEQHDDGPSCYRDTVPAGAEALHHVAIIADAYDETLESYRRGGFEIASDGWFGDVRFCYVDTSPTLGHMTEILEDKPAIRRFFGAIVRAADSWDGNQETLLRVL